MIKHFDSLFNLKDALPDGQTYLDYADSEFRACKQEVKRLAS